MRDAFLLQPLHDAQQLPPEAFQKVEREPAFLADAVREGVGAGLVLGAGHRDEQRCVAGQLHVAMERDDVRMTQQSEHLALAPDASVERGFEGDLEHTIAVLVAHLEGDGGGTPAEASFHAEAMLQPVARIGVERMNDGFLLLAHLGELALCVHDQAQELRDGIGAFADLRVGGGLHDQLQGTGETVDRVREPEAACARQPLVQGRDGRCRRLSREQPIPDGTEREDVELLRSDSALGRFRRKVDVGLVVAGEAERGKRSDTR